MAPAVLILLVIRGTNTGSFMLCKSPKYSTLVIVMPVRLKSYYISIFQALVKIQNLSELVNLNALMWMTTLVTWATGLTVLFE